MPSKTIYVKDEALWQRAKTIGAQYSISMSQVVEDALIRYCRSETEPARPSGHYVPE